MIKVTERCREDKPPDDWEYFRGYKPKPPPCTGLARMARDLCSFWGTCRNCRLNNHRLVRCGYFERAVLPADKRTAEKYASALDVLLEPARHGKLRVAHSDAYKITEAA